MKFLWKDSTTGKASSSKLWTHIAYGVATYIVIKTANDANNWQMLLVYLTVVGGSEIAKKLLTLYFAAKQDYNKVDKKE